jgi:hypothetical protein
MTASRPAQILSFLSLGTEYVHESKSTSSPKTRARLEPVSLDFAQLTSKPWRRNSSRRKADSSGT